MDENLFLEKHPHQYQSRTIGQRSSLHATTTMHPVCVEFVCAYVGSLFFHAEADRFDFLVLQIAGVHGHSSSEIPYIFCFRLALGGFVFLKSIWKLPFPLMEKGESTLVRIHRSLDLETSRLTTSCALTIYKSIPQPAIPPAYTSASSANLV
jgi:hypothetical protein